jgi:hypothetical protein
VPEISEQVMAAVLRFMYYDCREITEALLFDVFSASRFLGIDALFKVCERKISLAVVPANFALIF